MEGRSQGGKTGRRLAAELAGTSPEQTPSGGDGIGKLPWEQTLGHAEEAQTHRCCPPGLPGLAEPFTQGTVPEKTGRRSEDSGAVQPASGGLSAGVPSPSTREDG